MDLATHPVVLAFLHQAQDHPEDDTHRLVLADWLEDHGDPARAEFIRLSCRLASGQLSDPPARQRQRDLLDRHGGGWLGSLWKWWLTPVAWHRGLLTTGLPQRLEARNVHGVLPWLDTAVVRARSRRTLQDLPSFLTQVRVNHLVLDLRQTFQPERLLTDLGQIPSSSCLRTLTFQWPGGMLQRSREQSRPNLPNRFLSELLRLPVGQHLTHLASLPGWSIPQARLLSDLGVQAVEAEHRLWMHDRQPSCFRACR
jgi:uncharacterized protein (TIGR02996 family)